MTELRVRTVGLGELPRCQAIRREVFIEGQGVPAAIEVDGRDPQCLHLLAERRHGDDWTPVGTARMRIEGDAGIAQRVAVLARARGLGVGKALMRAMEQAARGRGLARITLHAQATAIPFYLRIGYEAHGDEFLEAGIVHREMTRALAGR